MSDSAWIHDLFGTDTPRTVEVTFRFINASVAARAKGRLERCDGFEVELRPCRADDNDGDEFEPDDETIWGTAWLRTAKMDEEVVFYVRDILNMEDESEIYILTCGPATQVRR